MKENLDIMELSNKLGIEIPNAFRILNEKQFIGNSEVQLQFPTNFQSGFTYNNGTSKIVVDSFINKKSLESYWRGRMGSDLWINDAKYLGIAKCESPQGYIVWSLNDKDFGSIYFEYTYEHENLNSNRILLEENLNIFLRNLIAYTFEDRKCE